MSALGHWRTFAPQNVMSALPQKRTCAVQWSMSALGQKRILLKWLVLPSVGRKGSDQGISFRSLSQTIRTILPMPPCTLSTIAPGALSYRLAERLNHE